MQVSTSSPARCVGQRGRLGGLGLSFHAHRVSSAGPRVNVRLLAAHLTIFPSVGHSPVGRCPWPQDCRPSRLRSGGRKANCSGGSGTVLPSPDPVGAPDATGTREALAELAQASGVRRHPVAPRDGHEAPCDQAVPSPPRSTCLVPVRRCERWEGCRFAAADVLPAARSQPSGRTRRRIEAARSQRHHADGHHHRTPPRTMLYPHLFSDSGRR